MENTTITHLLTSERFTAFYDVAEEFCDFIEDGLTFNSVDYLDDLRSKLVLLYEKAMDLPWVDLKSVEDFDHKMNNSYFEKILKSIANNLQDKRHYWDVSNPSPTATENRIVNGDLVDNIGAIYKALKYSINIYNSDKKDGQEVAIWQFKFDFEYNWGSNCINAIRAIHFKI